MVDCPRGFVRGGSRDEGPDRILRALKLPTQSPPCEGATRRKVRRRSRADSGRRGCVRDYRRRKARLFEEAAGAFPGRRRNRRLRRRLGGSRWSGRWLAGLLPAGANVDNGARVPVDAPPTRQTVKTADRTLPRLQHRPADLPAVEEIDEDAFVAVFGIDVTGEKHVAEQLDAAIDKGWDAAKGQIAAESLAVEEASRQPQVRC